ncbi:DUF2130 domain-containing protein [Streptococcus entericus]|uniref:DUF2130 domain-containing protein n=1 Tax=Streptococcus entericus TaxID=155680 RepID=UPI00035F8AAA|nr:DUF2130 domain-containing protein [Streptococcus entericus]
MNQIRCPHCGTSFTVNETEYSQLLAQVRGAEFDKELHDRLTRETQLLKEKSKNALQSQLAEKDRELTALAHQLDTLKAEQELALSSAMSKKDQELAQVRSQLEQRAHEEMLAAKQSLADKEQELARVTAQLAASQEAQQAQLAQVQAEQDKQAVLKDRAQQEAIARLEKERDEARTALLLQEQRQELALATTRQEYDLQLKAANEQVEFYKNFKAQQSTKAIGESLELYAETEFNKVRAYAFPKASFGKDNLISESGSKGDYIFRETDDNGLEILSIMFEMKNEADTTARKHKNEDFLKELDKDRREKNCEYAVLVSMLEADSDYYNTGIVDVSHHYPKMYVIRPQFFIQLIGLLRNAALNSLSYKQELELVRSQNIDITTFEADLETFKTAFAKNYTSASTNFKKAIDEIDKAIKRMEEVKRFLTTSDNQLRLANNKLEDVSVKKLTRKNPTMKAKFEALKKE